MEATASEREEDPFFASQSAAGARDSLSPFSYISIAASGLEFYLSEIGVAVLCSAIAGGFNALFCGFLLPSLPPALA